MNKIEILKNWLDLYHKLANRLYDDLTDYEKTGLFYLVEDKINSLVDLSSISPDLGIIQDLGAEKND